MSPVVRLIVRAVLAGLGAFCTAWLADPSDWAKALVGGVLVAVGLATAELATPINPTVGVGKS